MSLILIIGGNSDIGYASAKIFAKNKYDVHLVSRNIEQLNINKKEIVNLYNVKCKITCMDLLEQDQINKFFKENTLVGQSYINSFWILTTRRKKN